jgi:twitching motility protein PilT
VAQRLVPRVGSGLVAAYEILLGTQPVTNLIREGKANQLRNAMQIALAAGHKTLEMSLNELVAAGVITHETALQTAFVPHEIAGTNTVSPLLA